MKRKKIPIEGVDEDKTKKEKLSETPRKIDSKSIKIEQNSQADATELQKRFYKELQGLVTKYIDIDKKLELNQFNGVLGCLVSIGGREKNMGMGFVQMEGVSHGDLLSALAHFQANSAMVPLSVFKDILSHKHDSSCADGCSITGTNNLD